MDDLLIIASKQEMDGLCMLLTEAFKSITMEVEGELSFLGMQIEWKDKGFDISMDYYLEQLLNDWVIVC